MTIDRSWPVWGAPKFNRRQSIEVSLFLPSDAESVMTFSFILSSIFARRQSLAAMIRPPGLIVEVPGWLASAQTTAPCGAVLDAGPG